MDRGQRIVGDELAPRLLVAAGLRVRQPRLDVLAGRAARVARRQQIDVDRAALPDRARRARPCTRSGSGVTSLIGSLMPVAVAGPPLAARLHRFRPLWRAAWKAPLGRERFDRTARHRMAR